MSLAALEAASQLLIFFFFHPPHPLGGCKEAGVAVGVEWLSVLEPQALPHYTR